MVVMATVADEQVDSKIWFLDIGCSNHMTGRMVWLVDFDKSKKSKVKLADNSSLEVEGIDNIVIQRSNGVKAMIKDVLYVPGIKCNLLSVGKLVEKGFSMVMKDGTFEIFDTHNNLVLNYHLSKNRTFKTMISSTEVQFLKTIVDHNHDWLGHLRFGHLNFMSLNKFITQDMVTGIPSLEMPEKICEGFLVGKQSRKSFILTMPMRSSCILEVVHSDVCGPFEEKSIGGNMYFVSFVNEFSRKPRIYVIK